MAIEGRLLQVNVSRGGVPKRPVPRARVTLLGVEGDRQNAVTVHGGPHRAVSILGIDAIRRVAAEGHPIGPGTTGENLTIEGFDVSRLPAGSRLAIGAQVELELSAPAAPCETIRDSFVDGRFSRLSPKTHPSDSRMYARVITEGDVQPGDRIVVTPPASDAAERHLLAIELDEAEAAWCRALWRAARDAGEEVHVISDGDLAIAASPGLRWPSFNVALGLVMLPHLANAATRHFDEHRVTGWLQAESPALPGLEIDAELGRYAIDPRELAGTAGGGVSVRELSRDEVGPWGEVMAQIDDFPAAVARAYQAAEAGLAAAAHHRRFVAEIDGRPVGAASLHTRHKVGWLCAAVVAPHARGRGIQRRLIAARAARAASLGCAVIGASVVAGGASERNLQRLGFRQVAVRRDYRYEPRPTAHA